MSRQKKCIQKRSAEKINKILFCLKEADTWLHIRKIAKITDIHPQSVLNIINRYLINFLEVQNFEEFGLRVKLVKLKDKNTDLESVIKLDNLIKRARK